MKRKLLTILLIGIICMPLIGCTATQEKVDQAIDNGATVKMIMTDITIEVGDLLYQTYYDPNTKIVYIADATNQRSGITPYLNENKQPMLLDEFLKLYKK